MKFLSIQTSLKSMKKRFQQIWWNFWLKQEDCLKLFTFLKLKKTNGWLEILIRNWFKKIWKIKYKKSEPKKDSNLKSKELLHNRQDNNGTRLLKKKSKIFQNFKIKLHKKYKLWKLVVKLMLAFFKDLFKHSRHWTLKLLKLIVIDKLSMLLIKLTTRWKITYKIEFKDGRGTIC